MTQAELEAEMVDGGRATALARFSRNEGANDAASNPYAQAIFRRFVVPLAEGLSAYVNTTQRGIAAKNKVLLRGIDTLSLSYITVRGVINATMADFNVPMMRVALDIGKTVHGEVLLEHFQNIVVNFPRHILQRG